MSDTPRVDAATAGCFFGPFVQGLADLARELERENAALRAVVRRAVDDRIDDAWLANARVVLEKAGGA